MKRVRFGAWLLLVTVTPLLRGQEAADVDLHKQPTDQRTQPETTPAPIPSPTPRLPERSQIDEAFRQTSLGKAADDRRLHLEWRQLANEVANDPNIIAAKKFANTAPTDLEKRQRLREYYDIYYGRMRALATSSEMKKALDELKLAHISRTSQPRVRATTDSALPTPDPTPKIKVKRHSWERASEGG